MSDSETHDEVLHNNVYCHCYLPNTLQNNTQKKSFTSGRDFPWLRLYIFTLFTLDTCISKALRRRF